MRDLLIAIVGTAGVGAVFLGALAWLIYSRPRRDS